MRTLHVDLGLELRGGQYQALSLVEALGEEAVLMAREGSPLWIEAEKRGLRLEPARASTLRKTVRAFDLSHAHDAHAHQWLALVSKGPFVVSRRVAFPVKTGPLSRWKYSRPAHFLAVSNYVAGELARAGVRQEKITVVYDGVEIPASMSRGGSILAIRSQDPGKGTALIEKTGLNVRWSTSLLHDLQSASVFLYLTDSEGLGSAALLAMAAGVPVVASNVGGLREIIQHGVTGMLTGSDPNEIAIAIEEVLAARDTMAVSAREHVRDNFTRDRMVEQTRQVYRKVLS